MAYSTLPTKASQDLLTLGDYGAIKGNFEAGCPDIITAKGDLCVGTGPNAAARLTVGSDNAVLVADQYETVGMEWQTIPGARVYNSGNGDPEKSTWVTLGYDTERTDPEGMHTASSWRLIVPTGGDGLYVIGGHVVFDDSGASSGGSIKGLQIVLNRTTPIAMHMVGIVHGSFDSSLSIQTMYELAAGDFVELQVYTSTDVDVVAIGNYSPEFWAVWQRRSRTYL